MAAKNKHPNTIRLSVNLDQHLWDTPTHVWKVRSPLNPNHFKKNCHGIMESQLFSTSNGFKWHHWFINESQCCWLCFQLPKVPEQLWEQHLGSVFVVGCMASQNQDCLPISNLFHQSLKPVVFLWSLFNSCPDHRNFFWCVLTHTWCWHNVISAQCSECQLKATFPQLLVA